MLNASCELHDKKEQVEESCNWKQSSVSYYKSREPEKACKNDHAETPCSEVSNPLYVVLICVMVMQKPFLKENAIEVFLNYKLKIKEIVGNWRNATLQRCQLPSNWKLGRWKVYKKTTFEESRYTIVSNPKSTYVAWMLPNNTPTNPRNFHLASYWMGTRRLQSNRCTQRKTTETRHHWKIVELQVPTKDISHKKHSLFQAVFFNSFLYTFSLRIGKYSGDIQRVPFWKTKSFARFTAEKKTSKTGFQIFSSPGVIVQRTIRYRRNAIKLYDQSEM